MAEIVLAAETGRPTGSSASRRLRAEGKVPAVVYGRGTEALSVTVGWRELRAALTTDRGVNALIMLNVGGRPRPAVVKDIQRHPVRRDVLHVDFLEVDVDQPISTDVGVVLEGEADKVTREQGAVEQVLNSLLVTGKPADIPAHIVVDVAELEVGQPITVGDLTLPPGVTTEVDPAETVVTAHLTSAAMIEEEGAEGGGEEPAGGEAEGGGE